MQPAQPVHKNKFALIIIYICRIPSIFTQSKKNLLVGKIVESELTL